MKYKEAFEKVTKSKEPEITIQLKDESSDKSLAEIEKLISDSQIFGLSRFSLLNEEEVLSVPNPELQKLINQFSVFDYSINLNSEDLNVSSLDRKIFFVLQYFSKILSELEIPKMLPYFIENVLPHLDCPLNVENLKVKGLKLKDIKEKQLFYYSLNYCFSLLYKGSMTTLGTKIYKPNFINFAKEHVKIFEKDTLKIRLYNLLLFAQDRKNDYLLLNIPRADGFRTNLDSDGNQSKVSPLYNLAAQHVSVNNIDQLNKDYVVDTESTSRNNYLSRDEYKNRYDQAVLVLQIKLSKIKSKEDSNKKFSTLNEQEKIFLKECQSLFMTHAFKDKKNFEERFKNLILSLELIYNKIK